MVWATCSGGVIMNTLDASLAVVSMQLVVFGIAILYIRVMKGRRAECG